MRHKLSTFALSGLLCLGVTAGTAGTAFAQDAPTAQQDAQGGEPMHHGHAPMSTDQQLTHLTKALDLTADQQAKIKPMLEARRQQMMQMHDDTNLTHEDRMAKFKALDESTHANMAAVLDDKQKAKLAKMAERREEHMDHAHQPGAEAPPQQ